MTSLKWWSRRAVHWKPFRGEVSFQVPTPVTGKLQGMAPIGESMGVAPEQLEPRICPAVRKERSGAKEAGKSFAMRVEMLPGRACCMSWMNCGVRMETLALTATSERSTSPETKKKVLSLRMGPPTPHENSLRPKSGILNPLCSFWK